MKKNLIWAVIVFCVISFLVINNKILKEYYTEPINKPIDIELNIGDVCLYKDINTGMWDTIIVLKLHTNGVGIIYLPNEEILHYRLNSISKPYYNLKK